MDSALQLMRARARGLSQGLEGEISLAVDVMVPLPVLTAVLCAFRRAFPTIGVRLHTSALGGVADLVQRREADLGVAGLSDGQLVAQRLGSNRMVPVAAPNHPLASEARPVPAVAIREHFQIVITDPTEQTKGADFHVHAFNIWRVTDATTKLALIREGLGWGGLPEWMIAGDIPQGRLVELDLEPYPRTEYTLYAMRAPDAPYGPAATWLVGRFEEVLGQFAAHQPLVGREAPQT